MGSWGVSTGGPTVRSRRTGARVAGGRVDHRNGGRAGCSGGGWYRCWNPSGGLDGDRGRQRARALRLRVAGRGGLREGEGLDSRDGPRQQAAQLDGVSLGQRGKMRREVLGLQTPLGNPKGSPGGAQLLEQGGGGHSKGSHPSPSAPAATSAGGASGASALTFTPEAGGRVGVTEATAGVEGCGFI